jgi:endogenous inhibitor of DNA gyrase (YacG/DUF329 family)
MGAYPAQPKRSCPSCGRQITETPSGALRPHKIRSLGGSCPADNGVCAICGRVVPLDPDGTVRPHKQLRVRLKTSSRSRDGWLDKAVEPETYSSNRDCPGSGEKPEPVEEQS